MQVGLKELKKAIEEFQTTGVEPTKLIIGYKTYSRLMKEDKFIDHLSKDQLDPMVRYYKGIKIKMVTEKHYLEVK